MNIRHVYRNTLCGALRRLSCVVLALLLSGCATIDLDYPRTPSEVIRATDVATELGKSFEAHITAHPGESGFFVLSDGIDAFAARLLLADRAQRSIDTQYFLIHDDLVGHAFFESLIRAADRGVRVRLLVDDIHTNEQDAEFAAMDAHENIEIRLFNPFRHRKLRGLDVFGGPRRMLRRMHNKSFTADNKITIIGGRNMGDEYFEAREDIKFGDLDVAAVGPVVDEVSSMFDLYWNHESALPMPAISGTPDDPGLALKTLRETFMHSINEANESRYAAAIRSSIADRLQASPENFNWAPYRLVFDSPDKNRPGKQDGVSLIKDALRNVVAGAQTELLVASPYLVLRDEEVKRIGEIVERGVDVTILTNTLASNNHAVSHSGYASIRKPLLKNGVKLYELRPDARIAGDERVGVENATATLHAKAFAIDRKRLFIGSFNWNQRSENIDTEMGVIIESEPMALSFADRFSAIVAENAYSVFLNEKGKLRWQSEENGQPVLLTKEPQTSFWLRFSAGFLRILPIKSQL